MSIHTQSNSWYSLHDNDKRWRSNASVAWRFNHGISDIPVQWPLYSPDLNPIENLFSVLAQRVWDRNPEGVDELREFLLDEWDRVEQEELAHLAYSMPHRCDAVIDSEGHKINY